MISFLGYFSAGTSYKWRHNTKCIKKKPDNTRCFWELDADYKQENVCQSWQQSDACNASSKVNGTLDILRSQNKWRAETHLTSCHVLLISIMSSLHPVCSSTPPPPASHMANTAKRDGRRPISVAQNAVPSTGSIPDAGPSCHMLLVAWGQLPRLSICLTWRESGCVFCNVRISPSQTCATGNPTGMTISRLPSASLQASSACIHVRLNLEADVGADIMTYWAVIDDTLPLTSCSGRNIQCVCVCVWGGMSVGLCSVVTCKKANEEPDIFRMVSVNQGWQSSAYMTETFHSGWWSNEDSQ